MIRTRALERRDKELRTDCYCHNVLLTAGSRRVQECRSVEPTASDEHFQVPI